MGRPSSFIRSWLLPDPRFRAWASIPPTATAAAAGVTAAPGFPRLGFVHSQPPPADFLIVEALNRRLSLRVGIHLDEAEPFALASVTVRDHLGALHGPVLAEPFFQVGLRDGISQITNIQFLSHVESPC